MKRKIHVSSSRIEGIHGWIRSGAQAMMLVWLVVNCLPRFRSSLLSIASQGWNRAPSFGRSFSRYYHDLPAGYYCTCRVLDTRIWNSLREKDLHWIYIISSLLLGREGGVVRGADCRVLRERENDSDGESELDCRAAPPGERSTVTVSLGNNTYPVNKVSNPCSRLLESIRRVKYIS